MMRKKFEGGEGEIVTKLVEDGKLEEAFKELRKLPKSEVTRIWKIVAKEPVMPMFKEEMIYEIIKQLT